MKRSLASSQGSILPLVAVCMSMLFLMLAVVVDLTWIYIAKSEMQNAADAASMAAVTELLDMDMVGGIPNQIEEIAVARDVAVEFTAYNQAARSYLAMDRNDSNAASGGVVVGYIDNPLDMQSSFESVNPEYCNAVQVTVKFDETINGPLGLFLGSITGLHEVNVAARSVASIEDRILGFDVRADETLMALPFSVYVHAFEEAFDGNHHLEQNQCPHQPDVDNYSYENGVVIAGKPDGIPEITMYPQKQDTCGVPGMPGNYGTIDLGASNNSTDDLVRQILYGISGADLIAMGGLVLEDLDGDGIYSKWLNGDTGVSTSIKSALQTIKGQPRLLPLHRDAFGSGNGAMYELIKFVGVRVMDVVMTGALEERHIIVQPALVIENKVIVHPSAPHSRTIYATALVR